MSQYLNVRNLNPAASTTFARVSAYARKGEVFINEHTTSNGRGLLCYIVWRVSHDLDTAYSATAPPPVSFYG